MVKTLVGFGLVTALLGYAPGAAAHDSGHSHSHGGIAVTIGHGGFGFQSGGSWHGHGDDGHNGHHYNGHHHPKHWSPGFWAPSHHYYPGYYRSYVPAYHHDHHVGYYCPVCHYRTTVVTTYISHVHHHHHVPACHISERIVWNPAYSAYVYLDF